MIAFYVCMGTGFGFGLGVSLTLFVLRRGRMEERQHPIDL
jgi:hypothetical protein